jgi:hypothetical protein
MADGTNAGAPPAAGKARGRKLLMGVLAIAGTLVLLLWSFVLPIFGIIHVLEMLGQI